MEGAVRSYLGGVAFGAWRSTGEVLAAVEAMLDYRVERHDVSRALRMLRDGEGVVAFRIVELAPEVQRTEWRWRRRPRRDA